MMDFSSSDPKHSNASPFPSPLSRSQSPTPPTAVHTNNVLRRPTDSFSNLSNFAIIDSTLREGEQFQSAHFTTQDKLDIARALDRFGVEYIEVTNPAASPQSLSDCIAICQLGLRAKVLAHVRCHMDDVRIAADSGVHGLSVVIGTSSLLRKYSHGKDMSTILSQATEVIRYIQSRGLEVRFSSEDAFRSDLLDLITIYRHMDSLGVNRIGIADTVGCADPRQVYDLIRLIRGLVRCDIEVHFHDDCGCAVANAFAALEAGATHIDTCVLGIGERNGITPLGGLVARTYTSSKTYILNKYNVAELQHVDQLVAGIVGIEVPFNTYITGSSAFTHKAGIHSKAVLNNPETYEILNPHDFNLNRTVAIGHRLTGWNSIKARVAELDLAKDINDDACKLITNRIKSMADQNGPLDLDAVDQLIRSYHLSPESWIQLILQPNSPDFSSRSLDVMNRGRAAALVSLESTQQQSTPSLV